MRADHEHDRPAAAVARCRALPVLTGRREPPSQIVVLAVPSRQDWGRLSLHLRAAAPSRSGTWLAKRIFELSEGTAAQSRWFLHLRLSRMGLRQRSPIHKGRSEL